MVSAQDMPPIEVYQVGKTYFVVDGNHRVSIARQEGMKAIEAYVCEFVTPVGLSPEADLDEVITKSGYAEFLYKTRLDKLRPRHEIVFTNPGHYRELAVCRSETLYKAFMWCYHAEHGKKLQDSRL